MPRKRSPAVRQTSRKSTALSGRFVEALGYAARIHARQLRKGKDRPYVGHLLSVASIVIEHGGDEVAVIAALLHDAVEDQGGLPRLREIRRKFGARVAAIVDGCTDSHETPKPPWRARKAGYISRIRNESAEIRLVSAADKLSNARELLADHRLEGDSVFERFHGRKDGTLWYYRALVTEFRAAGSTPLVEELDRVVTALENRASSARPGQAVYLTGSGVALGSRRVPSEGVDREFDMPIGKLRDRAGIVSIVRAAEDEDECALAARAAAAALSAAGAGIADVDRMIATSETFQGYPSLGARLHSALRGRPNCGVVDVGGACLGLLYALDAARHFLAAGQGKTVLVVTSDVHSRQLTPGRVAGEFGGLFGDGASAFLVQSAASRAGSFQLGEFHFGCAGHYSKAIQVKPGEENKLSVQFDGEALSRAAVSQLEKTLRAVELQSGHPLDRAAAFATHQPNPRLVALLARQLGVPVEKFPPIARDCGNLGSTS